MTSLKSVLAAAAALSLLAAPAYAQNLNTGASGTFGQASLRAGFMPDPHAVTVNAGGGVDASSVNENCVGFIAARPSFSLRYRGDGRTLYLGASSDEADATIAVRGPNGTWYCDDDSAGALNPAVAIEAPRNGRYQIWVGRFGIQSETAPAVLHISEVAPPAPTEPEYTEMPDFTLDPAYGVLDLAAGFMPDPRSQAIAAGGSLNARAIEGCVGSIAQAPDYRVNWTAGSGALPLTFHVQSDADTTLVINDAQGNWVCNDDSDGLNPVVSFENAPSGQYDIWVGTYSEGELQDSTLYITEVYTPEEHNHDDHAH